MSVKGTKCNELCGFMYVKPSVYMFLNHMQENKGLVYTQCMLAQRQRYVTFLIGLQGDCPNCKHARRPNKFQKEAAQQVSPCKPSPFDILSMNLYMSVYCLNYQNCNVTGRYRITHTQGPKKRNYIHTIYPPKKNYLIVFFNIAQGMRSGHRNCNVTGREMPLL